MQGKGIFQKVFGRFMTRVASSMRMHMFGGYTPVFTPFGDDAYESDVVRATVDAVARNAAKLKAKHIRRIDGKIQPANGMIERLLTIRPNPKDSAFDFQYKVFSQAMLRSNAFVLIDRATAIERYRVRGFYPIDYAQSTMLEKDDELFIQFQLRQGGQMTVPYSDVIHLRRFYYSEDFGSGNAKSLMPTLELIHATNQGIINAIKSSAFVRGILKFTQNLHPDDRKKQTEDFIRDYLNPANGGGVAATDVKAEFVPLNNDPKMIDSKQMALIEQKVYKYFGVNEKIINSTYSEDEWNAFYESVIEPLAIQLSLEATSKVFSQNEQNHGNEIIYESNRLQYASNETKIKVVELMTDRGLISQNQALEIFNMPPIEGGDKRIISLNFIDADAATEYQLGKVKKPTKPAKGGEEEDDDDEDGDA